MRTQRMRINPTARGRHHIPNQPLLAPLSPRDHNRLPHTRMAAQNRLDLPGLNAEPAQLHLIVRTPHKLQHPVRTPARKVPAPVHPAAACPMRVRNKPLRRQPRTMQIPTRQPRPRNVKLPAYPNRNSLQRAVQHVDAVIGQRTPNRHPHSVFRSLICKGCRINRGLGGPIQVPDLRAREPARNLAHKLGRQLLSPKRHMLQCLACGRVLEHRGKIGRHAADEVHPMLFQFLPKLRGGCTHCLADDYHRSPSREWQQHLLYRGIEATSNEQRGTEVLSHLELSAQAEEFVAQTGMLDHGPFRLSRGA